MFLLFAKFLRQKFFSLGDLLGRNRGRFYFEGLGIGRVTIGGVGLGDSGLGLGGTVGVAAISAVASLSAERTTFGLPVTLMLIIWTLNRA